MSMRVYTHENCLEHRLYPFFAEKPERLYAVVDELTALGLNPQSARKAGVDELALAHSLDYITHIEQVSESGPALAFARQMLAGRVQWYTRISKGSYKAARHAAGAVIRGVEDIANGQAERVFCAVRPPGHHAGPTGGEGFCLFNNVAIGALKAQQLGFSRVAVVDFDRHHGNGTQDILNGREGVLFVSSYQAGCKYSGNVAKAADNVVAVPIPIGSRFNEVAALYERQVLPQLSTFKPDLLLISAGFDLHESDPLSSVKLTAPDYAPLTRALAQTAGCPVVSVLEGGYDLQALRACVRHHVAALKA
jgi:acetoin utilization deacetylase AcuC-like enzyme